MVRTTRAEGLRTVSPVLQNGIITQRARMQMNLLASPDLRWIFQYPTLSYVDIRSDQGRIRSGDHGNVAV